ncbi:unnamed protein product [Pleuronectes platessa]|uniref:Uncharacterized protein n=1 Tax=Pleuronectes platessa TaxID=8262 RepID=A0A9N7YRP5_PLEPL|nr:unnamed protein product [Pleuronectes platessa]
MMRSRRERRGAGGRAGEKRGEAGGRRGAGGGREERGEDRAGERKRGAGEEEAERAERRREEEEEGQEREEEQEEEEEQESCRLSLKAAPEDDAQQAAPQVFLRCSSGVPQTFLRRSSDVPQVFLRCSSGVPQVFLRSLLQVRGSKAVGESLFRRAADSLVVNWELTGSPVDPFNNKTNNRQNHRHRNEI